MFPLPGICADRAEKNRRGSPRASGSGQKENRVPLFPFPGVKAGKRKTETRQVTEYEGNRVARGEKPIGFFTPEQAFFPFKKRQERIRPQKDAAAMPDMSQGKRPEYRNSLAYRRRRYFGQRYPTISPPFFKVYSLLYHLCSRMGIPAANFFNIF